MQVISAPSEAAEAAARALLEEEEQSQAKARARASKAAKKKLRKQKDWQASDCVQNAISFPDQAEPVASASAHSERPEGCNGRHLPQPAAQRLQSEHAINSQASSPSDQLPAASSLNVTSALRLASALPDQNALSVRPGNVPSTQTKHSHGSTMQTALPTSRHFAGTSTDAAGTMAEKLSLSLTNALRDETQSRESCTYMESKPSRSPVSSLTGSEASAQAEPAWAGLFRAAREGVPCLPETSGNHNGNAQRGGNQIGDPQASSRTHCKVQTLRKASLS